MFGNEKKNESLGTYDFIYFCDNCNEENEFDIPKGIRAKDYMLKTKCCKCGCIVFNPTARLYEKQGDDEE